MSSTIKLGNVVRDLTSGFTGIAVNRNTRLNGTIQYSVQPPSKDGTLPETVSLDENTLEFVEDGIADKATPPTYDAAIVLGSRVKCLLTGIEGLVESKTEYMNGCAAYLVCHKSKDKKNDTILADWVDQCRLEVIDEGISNKVVKPSVSSNGKQPGGAPMRGVPRF